MEIAAWFKNESKALSSIFVVNGIVYLIVLLFCNLNFVSPLGWGLVLALSPHPSAQASNPNFTLANKQAAG